MNAWIRRSTHENYMLFHYSPKKWRLEARETFHPANVCPTIRQRIPDGQKLEIRQESKIDNDFAKIET